MDDTGSKIFKKNDGIVGRKIAGELFLVPIRGKIADMQRIFSLNPVGEFIWHNLDGQKTLSDIRNQVIDNFLVDTGEAESDIREFISELIKADLIKE